MLGMFLVVRGAYHVRVPVDERWYERFPHAAANATGLDGLPDALRKDWQFFHTRETTQEIEEQRVKLTRGRLLPRMLFPRDGSPSEAFREMNAELGEKPLRTLAVWDLIYGE